MIIRDVESVGKLNHDVIVVGGGVYGATIALECVARGLRPLLVERGDFGGETSSHSLRIVHGGLRYLQDLSFGRFRRSVEQRRWWLRTFPELVRPLPCLMPLYGEGARRPSVLRMALLLNDALSADRNRGVRPDRRIPPGAVLTPEETIERFPGSRKEDLLGGALWFDAFMESPHRLIMEILRWVAAGGGGALNYVEARELRLEADRVVGVVARDRLTGNAVELSTSTVVNASGPWSACTTAAFGDERPELFRPSLAFNLLLRRRLSSRAAVAVAEPGRGASIRFLVPVGDLTLAGTVHAPWDRTGTPPTSPRPTDAQISSFLEEIGRAIPEFQVGSEDVIRVFSGLLPAAEPGASDILKTPVVVDHGSTDGPVGLISVSGVKFTTAPAVAELVLEETAHGSRAPDWERLSRNRPELRDCPEPPSARRIAEDPGGTLEEMMPRLREIVSNESVVFAEDLALRRLDWRRSDLDLETGIAVLRSRFPQLKGRPGGLGETTPPGDSLGA